MGLALPSQCQCLRYPDQRQRADWRQKVLLLKITSRHDTGDNMQEKQSGQARFEQEYL